MSAEIDGTFSPDTKLIRRYIDWLEQFPQQHAKNWGLLYNQSPEAAMCEATYWGVLLDCAVQVEPNPSLLTNPNEKSPDFRCEKNGHEFYLEVTCIKVDTATRRTNLEHLPESGKAPHYSNLNQAIFHECQNKSRQCSAVDAPCLLGIGTYHFSSSVLCASKRHLDNLFTSPAKFALDVRVDSDGQRTYSEPYPITDLSGSIFLKPGKDELVESARVPISGVIVGGFGCKPPNVLGVLHPDAKYPFNARLLDRIEFARLTSDYKSGVFEVVWENGEAD